MVRPSLMAQWYFLSTCLCGVFCWSASKVLCGGNCFNEFCRSYDGDMLHFFSESFHMLLYSFRPREIKPSSRKWMYEWQCGLILRIMHSLHLLLLPNYGYDTKKEDTSWHKRDKWFTSKQALIWLRDVKSWEVARANNNDTHVYLPVEWRQCVDIVKIAE